MRAARAGALVIVGLLLAGCAPSAAVVGAAPAAPALSESTPVATAPTEGLSLTGDAPTVADVGGIFAPVNVLLTDAGGAPIADAPVSFTVVSGDAVFADGIITTTTDASGVATGYGLIAGAQAGRVVLSVAAPNDELDVTLTVRG